jgi:hypothetical protein
MHILRIGLEPAAAIDIAPVELVSRSPDPKEEPVYTGVSVAKAFGASSVSGGSPGSVRKAETAVLLRCGRNRLPDCAGNDA